METTELSTRWMLRSDRERVLDIDFESFDPSWDEEILDKWLREKQVVGIVAQAGLQVVGYLVYATRKRGFEIIRLAVDPESRRMGAGKLLVEYLMIRLESRDWKRHGREIVAHVPERDLAAQLFLKRLGFKHTDTYPDTYEIPCGEGEEPAKQSCYEITYSNQWQGSP